MRKMLIILTAIHSLGFTLGDIHAKPERILRVSQSLTEPSTLDPHMHHNIETEDITRQICEHLVDRDPSGKLIPSLATSWRLINETTWQFKLRKGVEFHNGEEFNSKTVKFSMDRIIDPNRKSPQKHWFESIDHVDVVDDYAVNFATKGIDILLPARLSSFRGNIVPINYLREVGDAEFGKHPVGTGPFKFDDWLRDKELVLAANKEYWGGAPAIDKVIFRFIPDLSEQIAMLKNGELDIVSNISPRSALDLKKNPRSNMAKAPAMQYIAFRMNTLRNGPFKDVRVRRALNYAIDTDKLIRYVYKGNAKRLATITMPEEFGFNRNLKPYPFDLKKARELMAEAGYANGFQIALLSFEDLESLAVAIKSELSRLGVTANISLISRDEYLAKITDRSIDFDAVLGNPTDPFFDAGVQLDLMFNSKRPFCRYQNKEIDELLYRTFRTSDEREREVVLNKIQEIIYSDAPNVFLFQIIRLYGLAKNCSNFVPYADGLLRLNTINKR